MGMDLLLTIIEIKKDKKPVFLKAHEHAVNMTTEQAIEATALARGMEVEELLEIESVDPDSITERETYGMVRRGYIVQAVADVMEAWKIGWRSMYRISLRHSDAIVAGGNSWGESIETCDTLELFMASGCSKKAGF